MSLTLPYISIIDVSSGGGSGNRKAKEVVGKKGTTASQSAVNKEKQKEKTNAKRSDRSSKMF